MNVIDSMRYRFGPLSKAKYEKKKKRWRQYAISLAPKNTPQYIHIISTFIYHDANIECLIWLLICNFLHFVV